MAKADYGCAPAAPRTIRCAIYTRKSTEDGLEQDFNSLDAQREACAAYVLSQRHEGWVLVPGSYDDGGFSGGSLERPGLRAVLEEVRANRIDVIVVYKVDRLTRSLADFAKIVEILDAADASFVSVTQAFNTTTSMGRLTLNVLGISVDEAAAGMGLKVDYFRVLVRISFLAPDIVAVILEGRQPGTLTRHKLARMTDLPLEWDLQRKVLGFADQLRDAA